MRDADYINGLWSRGGPFMGADGKPHTRVTVQRPWSTEDDAVRDGDEDHVIHPVYSYGTANDRGLPIRWYQKADNSQEEQEIPNVKIVTIDRSIETDAASCEIVLNNQWMYDNGAVDADQLAEGNRHLAGFFNPQRGVWPESQARWGQQTNEWENTIVPNAILRTYQGYGGHSKTLTEAIDDGNLLLTGVWLIDEVNLSTSGDLKISCRDMGKLLVDQQLYPPLVPSDHYPLTYHRWTYTGFSVRARLVGRGHTTVVAPSGPNRRAVYRDSSSDRWNSDTYNFPIHGHTPTQSIDGQVSTFWLSEGHSGPTREFATPWIEFSCGEMINAVYLRPWAGNYELYVSVMVNGIWQGSSTVPYDHTELIGEQPVVVDTGADIPYVRRFAVPWETGRDHMLPQTYLAERVRFSFRNLAYTGQGPNHYRAGAKEIRLRAIGLENLRGGGDRDPVGYLQPIAWGADMHPESGYITATNLWQIDAFGAARRQTADAAVSTADVLTAIAFTPTALGYYAMDIGGRILTFGDATHLGDPFTDGFDTVQYDNGALDLAVTATGEGYYALTSREGVFTYGDAVDYTQPTFEGTSGFIAIEAHPTGEGYWVMDGNGNVTARGDCVDYGDFSEFGFNFDRFTDEFEEQATDLQVTTTGLGYWILTNTGRVQAFGDATDFGQASLIPVSELTFLNSWTRLIADPDDEGFLLMRGDGFVTPFGDATPYGGPQPGSTGQLRSDGNYLDYADIIRDLALWSGFLLYDDSILSSSAPDVFGNIETTGAYAEEQLPDEIFDKRPVIDAMTEIKETVGYLLYVDDQGGLRFEAPNWWSPGNVMQETGQHITTMLEIDEKWNLLEYSTSRNDDSLRSIIIISSEDPTEAGDTTVTTLLAPQTAQGLRGILKPAMWVNGWFQHEDEQKITAELIALHIWFAQRLGQVTCAANPAIQINDQVRIYERQTSEIFVHYIRGVNTTHDLDSGEYTMTLTTNWLGSGNTWAITGNGDYIDNEDFFVVSPLLNSWIENITRGQGRVWNPGNMADSTFVDIDPNGPLGDGSTGSA